MSDLQSLPLIEAFLQAGEFMAYGLGEWSGHTKGQDDTETKPDRNSPEVPDFAHDD